MSKLFQRKQASQPPVPAYEAGQTAQLWVRDWLYLGDCRLEEVETVGICGDFVTVKVPSFQGHLFVPAIEPRDHAKGFLDCVAPGTPGATQEPTIPATWLE